MTHASAAADPPAGVADSATLRDIGRCLTGDATDSGEGLAAMVQRLQDRAMPGALIAPLRRRLAQRQLPRTLSFARLLFTPLDPLILAAPRWRRGQIGIPRTAIRPMAQQIGLELGPARADFDAMIAGTRPGDQAGLLGVGARLWPMAAPLIAAAAAPANWATATGLRAADHAAIVGVCAAALRSAALVQEVAGLADAPDPRELTALRGIVAASSGGDPLVTSSMRALLFGRLPVSGRLLAAFPELLGGSGDAADRLAGDQAIDFWLDAIEEGAGLDLDLTMAAVAIGRAAALLDAIELPGPAQRPSRRPRAEALRRRLDTACRTRFEQELSDRILAVAMLATKEAAPDDIEGVEATMRALKGFEHVARRLAGVAPYERLLRAAAGHVATLDATPRIDRIRLIEIMLGSEAALALA